MGSLNFGGGIIGGYIPVSQVVRQNVDDVWEGRRFRFSIRFFFLLTGYEKEDNTEKEVEDSHDTQFMDVEVVFSAAYSFSSAAFPNFGLYFPLSLNPGNSLMPANLG